MGAPRPQAWTSAFLYNPCAQSKVPGAAVVLVPTGVHIPAPKPQASMCASVHASRLTLWEREAAGLGLSMARRKEGAHNKRKENKAV